MTARTVDWAGSRSRRPGETPTTEGLRERKKRLLHQQLSDTATEMFMERGFDAVRIIEVAQACGVSEKTVYNYFPTKESLVLDRWEGTMSSLRDDLADPDIAPLEAASRILADELDAMTAWLAGQEDIVAASRSFRRFGDLIRVTPSLRAHQRDTTDRLISAVTEILAERAGRSADEPEPRIAAIAVMGLWDVQAEALYRYVDGTRSPAELRAAVTDDVRRAANLLADGLTSYSR